MSLLTEIRDQAVKSEVPVAELLRRCLVLAQVLRNEELKKWALLELKGYSPDEPLPNYRVVPSHPRGNLAAGFGAGYQNITIPSLLLPENWRQFAERADLRQSVAEIAALADSGAPTVERPWPGNLIAHMQDKFGDGLVLYGAWQTISRASLLGLLDAVRNRLLEFVMQLAEESPNLTEGTAPQVSTERVHQLVQTVIYGNVGGDVIAGVSGSMMQVKAHDLASLKAALAGLNVPPSDVTELEDAIHDDEKVGKGMGAKTKNWLSTLKSKVTAGAMSVVVEVVEKAIRTYLGI
jgi:hypothetical protein